MFISEHLVLKVKFASFFACNIYDFIMIPFQSIASIKENISFDSIPWTFLVAEANQPILGNDFLHDLLPDIRKARLIDGFTKLWTTGQRTAAIALAMRDSVSPKLPESIQI